jgi:long-chain acyl-CoA synthetase
VGGTVGLDLELYRRDVVIGEGLDVRLSVIDIDPGFTRGALLFVHGFGGQAAQWKYQLMEFSAEYRVIAPDLRGHHASSKPNTHYTLDEIVDDLAHVVASLEVPKPFIMVGHSFGGALVASYATRYPDDLERLVLIATARQFPLLWPARLAFRLPVAVLRPVGRFLRRALFAPPNVLKAFYNNAMAPWDGQQVFPHVRKPTLVIVGHRDRVFPQATFAEVPRLLPNAESIDVGASAHLVPLERPDAVNRAISRFLGDEATSWRARARSRIAHQRPWIKHYETGVPATVAVPRQPLYRFLESAARRHPLRTALIFYGRRVSYWELNEAASRFALGLQHLGVQKGDRAMLLLPNMPQAVIAYYGALKIGAVVVLTNPLFDEATLTYQLRDSGAETLVTMSAFYPMVRRARRNTSLRHVIVANIKEYLPPLKRLTFTLTRERAEGHRADLRDEHGTYRWGEVVHPGLVRPTPTEVSPDDLAVILYTGGTTDRPKGVMLSNYNLVANTIQVRHWLPDVQEGKEVVLGVLPFSHSYGMTACMNVSVSLAAATVLLPTFATHEVLDTVKRYRPTLFPGVPTMYTAISDYPGVRRFGLSSIRACLSGAAPLPVEVKEAFERLTRGRLVEGYGLTEASPVTHINPLGGRQVTGSIGLPIPNTDAKVVDLHTGEDLPPGEVGELLVRGPQVMQGYWHLPDETARALIPDPSMKYVDGGNANSHFHGSVKHPSPPSDVGADRWLRTGDVAMTDEDGYFRIIDRKKDMIIAGDYNVFPRDVEEVLYESPKVFEAAVVGIPYGSQEQAVEALIKAYVVLKQGERATEEEILAMCKARLEEWAVPDRVEFRTELPKSIVGKVLRRMLAEEEGAEIRKEV